MFNISYLLKLRKEHLIKLLRAASADQLSQFNGALYEQKDGMAMGFSPGQLLANVFMCFLEESLLDAKRIPKLCRRFLVDSCFFMPGVDASTDFSAIFE